MQVISTRQPGWSPFPASNVGAMRGAREKTVGRRQRLRRIVRLETITLVENESSKRPDGQIPVGDGSHTIHVSPPVNVNGSGFLVDFAVEFLVHDQKADNVLNFGDGNVQLLGDEAQSEARVWGDELDNGLCAHVSRDLVNILGYERVGQEILVLLENGAITVNVVSLVGIDQLGHCGDARIILVGLGLLRVERVDVGAHEHGCQDEILEHLYALQGASLVVIAERLEEITLSLLPIFCTSG